MLNLDRFTVKRGTQNIQNDCHQWLSDSFRVQLIRFPHWGSLQCSPDPLASLRGTISKVEGERRESGKGEEGEKKGRGGTPSPFANSWIRLWSLTVSENCSRTY